LRAAEDINSKLATVRARMPSAAWNEIVLAACQSGVILSAIANSAPIKDGSHKGEIDDPNPDHHQYFVYCAAASEVELDVLTGQCQILRTDIVYDCGNSLNPAVDIGQIEGSFMMNLGFLFSEKMVVGDDGRLINNGTWQYKPPSSHCIPIELNVTLLDNAPNPVAGNVMGSKASGEPPGMLATSCYMALKDAIYAARSEVGLSGYFNMDTPASVDNVQKLCGIKLDQLSFKS